MGKISQDSARRTATEVAKKISNKRTELIKEMQKEVTEIYKASVPAEIMKLWKKYPEWMRDTGEVRLEGHGFSGGNNDCISLIERLPTNERNYYNRKLPLTKEQGSKLWKMQVEVDNLREKYKKTIDEIQSTILALGTDTRVKEQLPEIYPYLPGNNGKTATALMVQVGPVREKVKCLVSTDSKCIDKI